MPARIRQSPMEQTLPYTPPLAFGVPLLRCWQKAKQQPSAFKVNAPPSHRSTDYGFPRDSQTQDVVPFMVVRVKPFLTSFSCVVDREGPEPLMVQRLARWIGQCDLVHVPVRPDREQAMLSLIWEAIKHAGFEKYAEEEDPEEEEEPELQLAVPEESAPGESQSNGGAEWPIKIVEDQARTLKLALEDRIQRQIYCSHPAVR